MFGLGPNLRELNPLEKTHIKGKKWLFVELKKCSSTWYGNEKSKYKLIDLAVTMLLEKSKILPRSWEIIFIQIEWRGSLLGWWVNVGNESPTFPPTYSNVLLHNKCTLFLYINHVRPQVMVNILYSQERCYQMKGER